MSSNGLKGARLALAGVSALLAAGGIALYRRPLATMRSAMRAGLRVRGASELTVDVDGLPVRYLEAGSGRTLVLVHGLGGSAEDWSLVIPALARDYRVIALDLPGFGKTPAPPEGMSFSTLARYLGGFLDALGVERVALAGNSLGGAVVIRYAAWEPERVERLFLLDSAGLLYDPSATLEPYDRDQARELMWLVTGRSRSPGFVLDDTVRSAADPARRAYLRGEEPTDVKDDLPRVTAPATIIWGSRDGLIPPDHGERLHAGIAGSELILLADTAHMPQLQSPREVIRILRERLG